MKRIHKLSAIFAAAALAAALTIPAQAAWESDINSSDSSVTQTKTDTLSASEKFAAEVLRLVNEERAARELEPLTSNETLAEVALVRAEESATKFAHVRPDGRSVSTAFSDAGLSYVKAGENLAHGYTKPETLVKDWMASKTHKANILNEEFTAAELGYYKNSAGSIYVALMFLTPAES